MQASRRGKPAIGVERGNKERNLLEQSIALFECFAMVEAGGVARLSLGGHAIAPYGIRSGGTQRGHIVRERAGPCGGAPG